jgi:hypothetical protein
VGGSQLALAADAQVLADVGTGHLHRGLPGLRDRGREHLVDGRATG